MSRRKTKTTIAPSQEPDVGAGDGAEARLARRRSRRERAELESGGGD
ncbi:hypothetical protein NEA10_06355 [Phormidium yuhuli AB48]|uniref:Uncharacterized protein n=1 Tax=Phormidium yuhuli AB48 TaxID=2940671 RepID=A0ABY5ASY8_9CYAN|nr:hypothetical protein [Phormidium yuhuli]USR92340.1 hypothetical protein NEA10_06355 [Phormidium yuhuli AB48]